MTIFELVAAGIKIGQFITLVLIASYAALVLTVIYLFWQLIRGLAFDCISIYTRAVTALPRQRAELEMWQLKGRAAIDDRRAMLQAGSAAMWKSGAYDIEVDE